MRLGCITFVLLFAGCVPAEPRRAPSAAPSSALRLVTWNVHDLFDGTDRTVAPGELDEVVTSAELEAKLATIGRVLALIDADVVLLQEVENVALLERLAAEALPGSGYRAFLREGADPRGIDVGVLSRIPFTVGPTHLGDRDADGRLLWARELLEVHLETVPRPLVVLGAHLVSRLDPRDDARRARQAARVREIVEDLGRDPRSPCVVVAGDLNDVPSSKTLSSLLSGGFFVDLGGKLSQEEAWTWTSGGARERIDYALMPAAGGARATRVAVVEGSDVEAASDHRPLVVDLLVVGGTAD
jgi:endonuclease/exonuclease/phosphatase family metal-dependent hydrolase